MSGKIDDLAIEELAWADVRDKVRKANPQLAEIIDQREPSKKHTFIVARYYFGDRILHHGVLHLPTKSGKTIPLHHDTVSKSIQIKLGYSSVPIALILNKSVEVFFETIDRVMPSKLFGAGALFGLWEAFDPPPSEFVKKVWNLSAGSRTIFMLAKISDAVSHTRLRRDFGISEYPPKTLLDQHKVFIELNRSAIHQEQGWFCDVLFFSHHWLETNIDATENMRLHNFWLKEAWKQSYNCRNQMNYDVAWEEFSKEITRRNWKPKSYIINIIKHLIGVGDGIYPGFIPAANNETAAPVKLIQQAYIEHYLLKYAPIVMQPHHLACPSVPVYYSLALPTLLEFAPRSRNSPNIMADIRELKMLMTILLDNMKGSNVDYQFFHSESDRFAEIRNANEMHQEDKNFLQPVKKYGDLNFPDNSPFFHGCVRVSLKEKH